MKRLVFILYLFLLLAACTRQESVAPMPKAPLQNELATIDTLMQTNPDSALFALLDFNETHNDLTPFDRHYADLLISEALFKSDYEQTTRPALRQSLSYFDSLADTYPKNDDYCLLSARSHYMNGVGLMEADSTVEACAEYLKALETVENHFDEKEIVGYKAKFMALTYNRLGDLFSDQFMMESAIAFYQKSLSFSKMSKTSEYGESKLLYRIGNQYDLKNDKDSASLYYSLALSSLPDTNNLIYRDISSNLALLTFLINHDTIQPIQQLKSVCLLADDENEKVTRALTIGTVYFESGKFDSAQIYLEKVFDFSHDSLSRIQAADCLRKIHGYKGNQMEAVAYDNFLANYTIPEYENRAVTSKLGDLFQQYLQQSNEKSFSNKKHRILNHFFIILGVLSGVVLIIIIIIRCRHRIKLNTLAEKSERLLKEHDKRHSQDLEKERHAHHEETEKLMDEIHQRDKKVETLKQRLGRFQEPGNFYEDFLNEPVCKKINDMICGIDVTTRTNHYDYMHLYLDDETIAELDRVVSMYFCNFRTFMTSKIPGMEKEDLVLCYLYLLGLEDKHVALLRHRNYSTVKRQARRLQEFFDVDTSFADFIRTTALKNN